MGLPIGISAFIGNDANISGGKGLQHMDAAFCVFVSQRWKKSAAGDQGAFDGGKIAAHVLGLVQKNFQVIRRTGKG